jgi:hypothetical protein
VPRSGSSDLRSQGLPGVMAKGKDAACESKQSLYQPFRARPRVLAAVRSKRRRPSGGASALCGSGRMVALVGGEATTELGSQMVLRVQSYAGRKADERPVRFQLRDREYVVEEVVDQWYGLEATFYKVRADDGNLYILRHNSWKDEWSLESFRRLQ